MRVEATAGKQHITNDRMFYILIALVKYSKFTKLYTLKTGALYHKFIVPQ